MKVEFRPTTHSDIYELHNTIPDIQYEELEYSSKDHPLDLMHNTLKWSQESYTMLVDGEVIAASGVIPTSLVGNTCNVWLFNNGKQPFVFMKYTKPLIKHWLSKWDALHNYVYSEYDATLRWAKWAGFDIHPARPYGPEKKPFNLITIGKEHGWE